MNLPPDLLVIPAGLLIGLLGAAPIGPVNIIVIQRAIERGFWGGIWAGAGAVLGDGLIALLAALGVSWVVSAVEQHRLAIQLGGGLLLAAFGAHLYLSQTRSIPADTGTTPGRRRVYVWDALRTFVLTVTNPGAILFMFATLGGTSAVMKLTSLASALTIVAAIMAGSLVWWVLLSWLVGRYRSGIGAERLRLINRVSGLVLIGFGVFLLAELALSNANAHAPGPVADPATESRDPA